MDKTGLAICTALALGAGKIPVPVAGPTMGVMIGYVCNKAQADDKYRRLVPVYKHLKTIVEFCKHSEAAEQAVKALGEEIAELPGYGACRDNFRREYIDKPDGWTNLPDDPNDLPFGFWW